MRFNINNGVVTVNGAELIEDKIDQRAANGIVHFIDDVIYPIPSGSMYQALNDDSRFITLIRAIEVAELVVGDLLQFEAGDIFTLEPGLYGEALRGGVRIENDYVLTEDGVIALSDSASALPS